MRIFLSILSFVVILRGTLCAQDEPPQELPKLFQLGKPDSKFDLNLGGGPPNLTDSFSGPVFSSSLEAPENPQAGDIVTLKLAVKVPGILTPIHKANRFPVEQPSV